MLDRTIHPQIQSDTVRPDELKDHVRLADISLNPVPKRVLKLEGATQKRFRLIDCEVYRARRIISIVECNPTDPENSMDPSPPIKYATISYVWNGNHKADVSESFNVFIPLGADGKDKSGDRISIEVLDIACQAALSMDVKYIWLDRLCILQHDNGDMAWQMSIMTRVYERASYCFVFPGGLGGLVGFDEHTSWIHRAWTLMEALLPEEVWCIFKWPRGNGMWGGVKRLVTREWEVIELRGGDGGYAMTRLEDALVVSQQSGEDERDEGGAFFVPDGECTHDTGAPQPFRLFSEDIQPMVALSAAMVTRQEANKARAIAERKLRPLTQMEQYEIDGAETAIWRCALMRISQHDQDIIYSIMGLFGVNLSYLRPSEVTVGQLMVELCTKILERGGRANWFLASIVAPVPRDFCTMPAISVADSQFLQRNPLAKDSKPGRPIAVAYDVMGFLVWFLAGAPTGRVTERGGVKFNASTSRVEISAVTKCGLRSTVDNNQVYPAPGFESIALLKFGGGRTDHKGSFAGRVGTYAICLGKFLYYPHYDDLDDIEGYQQKKGYFLLLMLVEKRADGSWQKTGMAAVTRHRNRSWERGKLLL